VSRILVPLAAGYRMGVALRRAAYRRGWFKAGRLKRPVVSVGNLTVGGTGKTPLVALLAERLVARGWKPSILTRGYGRRRGAEMIAVEPASNRAPDPREVGDEPALLARKLPAVPIVVGANRFRSGCLAEERFGVNVHILDDGFQHLALERDLDIVLLDLTQSLSGGALLPAGRLREPYTALQRAHIIILTRAEPELAPGMEERVRKLNFRAKIFTCSTRLRKILDFARGTLFEPAKCKDEPFLAFCGIGNARAFFNDLRQWGFSVAGEAAFADHHVYDAGDLGRLIERARRKGACALVTTEKDVMNFPKGWKPDFPVRACVIEAALSDSDGFESAVVESLKAARTGD
jgi:tetraacyldisaccharide 4'-kinase